jgi:hypothetical protein
MSEIALVPVTTPALMRAFIAFPDKHYQNDLDYVPLLRMERKAFYNPRKNPWFQTNEAAHFLARRHGAWVGRISAIHNKAHVATYTSGPHRDAREATVGFFGSFESINDPAVAAALLDGASVWLKARGLAVMRGPTTLSTNDDCGLRIDDGGGPPMFLMPHNPRWYPALVEAAGFAKAKDVLAYEMPVPDAPDERLTRITAAVRKRTGVTIRSFRTDKRGFAADVDHALAAYNSAWEANWGFIPMTPAEFRHIAKDMKQVMDPDLALLAFSRDGEPVGFSVTLPNLNECLIKMGGRLFPLGLFRLLRGRRRIQWVRVITMGVVPGYRFRGIEGLFYYDSMVRAKALGYRRAEISWLLEDNAAVRNSVEAIGATVYRTYRLYDRAIT